MVSEQFLCTKRKGIYVINRLSSYLRTPCVGSDYYDINKLCPFLKCPMYDNYSYFTKSNIINKLMLYSIYNDH